GVWQGESIQHWAKINPHPDSRFYGFDSFEGLPEDWGVMPKGAYSVGGTAPSITDSRVSFIKGWFQDTLRSFLQTFEPHGRVVVNNDSDLYSSTIYCLIQIDHLLEAGSLIIFDEFGCPQDEFRALNDYVSACHKKVLSIAITDDGQGRAAFV